MKHHHLSRNSGKYQWDATVVGIKDRMRQAVLLTVFCDDRQEAIEAVCREARSRGYLNPTVNHIARLR